MLGFTNFLAKKKLFNQSLQGEKVELKLNKNKSFHIHWLSLLVHLNDTYIQIHISYNFILGVLYQALEIRLTSSGLTGNYTCVASNVWTDVDSPILLLLKYVISITSFPQLAFFLATLFLFYEISVCNYNSFFY